MIEWIGQQGHEALNQFIASLEYVAFRFLILASTTSTWIWPFDKLSGPFQHIYEGFNDARWRMINFRNRYDEVVDALNSILDTTGLETLIEKLFDQWNAFRTDPKGYISGKMYELVDTWGSLKDDANRWVMYRIQGYNWYAWEWLTDPVGKLLDWLSSDVPSLYKLITDPAQGLRDALDKISHQAYLLVTDPVVYLKAWFVDSVGWSGEFWTDPWGYLLRELGNYLDDHMATLGHWLTRTGERIIRYIWNTRIYQ